MDPGTAIFALITIAVFMLAFMVVVAVPHADPHLLVAASILTLSQSASFVLDHWWSYPLIATCAMDAAIMVAFVVMALIRRASWKWVIAIILLAQISAHIANAMTGPAYDDYQAFLNVTFAIQLGCIALPCARVLSRVRRRRRIRTKEAAPFRTAPIPFDPYRGEG